MQQRTYLLGKRYKGEKKQVGENQYTEQRGQNDLSAKTSEKIAQQNNVSEKTVKRAEQNTNARRMPGASFFYRSSLPNGYKSQ